MRPEVIEQLLQINRDFYTTFAANFHRSRIEPADGFHILSEFLPQKPLLVLDVGCGNGRFGYFLHQHGQIAAYTGVDFSVAYMDKAAAWRDLLAVERLPESMFNFEEVNMMAAGFLDRYGRYDVVACLSAMHHIPTFARRQALLRELLQHVKTDGYVIIGNWQLLDSKRQRRKVLDWSTVGLTAADVEAGDYLVSWQRGGFGYRYVNLIDEAQTAALLQGTNARVVRQFRADGREKNLNLYTILQTGPTDNAPE